MESEIGAPGWAWTPAIWDWTPDKGRWSSEYRRPRDCVFLALSTSAVRPCEAYDYWRETVFYGFQADRPAADQRRAFRASAAGLIAPRGDLYWYQSDPISGHRDRRQCRSVSLGYQARVDDQGDEHLGELGLSMRW